MIYQIRDFIGTDVKEDGKLQKDILDLDAANMEPIMESSGLTNFPWDRRIKGLTGENTKILIAFCGEHIAGYVEYCRDWNDNANIYLSSIQIHQKHQSGILFRILVRRLTIALNQEQVRLLTSNVQKSNFRMIKIFKKLGFELKEGEHSHTFKVSGSIELLSRLSFK